MLFIPISMFGLSVKPKPNPANQTTKSLQLTNLTLMRKILHWDVKNTALEHGKTHIRTMVKRALGFQIQSSSLLPGMRSMVLCLCALFIIQRACSFNPSMKRNGGRLLPPSDGPGISANPNAVILQHTGVNGLLLAVVVSCSAPGVAILLYHAQVRSSGC